MKLLLNKRNILGGALFLLLVGELTVGAKNGLYTVPGFIVLAILYYVYFLLLESLTAHYDLDNINLTLVNFAFYAVLITGFFHGEIADYVSRPGSAVITTLIRIQCSFYPLFAFYLLRKIAPRVRPVPTVRQGLVYFFGYAALLSLSGNFGLAKLVKTFQTAPLLSMAFSILALLALGLALRRQETKPAAYHSRRFGVWTLLMLGVSLVPGLITFLILLVMMIVVSVVYLLKPDFRNASVT